MREEDKIWLFQSYAEEDDVEAVVDVIKRGTWWANGPEIAEFEDKISSQTDREYAVAVNSGTTAIYGMLMAHGVTEGEVIVPSFTFPATANAVVAAGAEPVFADIERDSLALSVDSVRSKLSDDTQAVMPIHFGGDVATDIFDIRALCEREDILLFEDACHSLGASYDRELVGSFGNAASFSFCFNKVISTGEGGMVVTDSEEVAQKLKQFRSHGRDEQKEYVTYGHNFRMSSMAAALGVTQVNKLGYIIKERRRMARYLNKSIVESEELKVPRFPEGRRSIYQLYNLRFSSTEIQKPLAAYLDERGIPSRVTYNPTHLTQYYQQKWGYSEGDLPVTEDVSKKILTLPFHLYLSDEDLDRIANAVNSFFEENV